MKENKKFRRYSGWFIILRGIQTFSTGNSKSYLSTRNCLTPSVDRVDISAKHEIVHCNQCVAYTVQKIKKDSFSCEYIWNNKICQNKCTFIKLMYLLTRMINLFLTPLIKNITVIYVCFIEEYFKIVLLYLLNICTYKLVQCTHMVQNFVVHWHWCTNNGHSPVYKQNSRRDKAFPSLKI